MQLNGKPVELLRENIMISSHVEMKCYLLLEKIPVAMAS